jgi:hypothetical protein
MIARRWFLATGMAAAIFAPARAEDGAPLSFYADLSADEQSAVTESPGKGHIEFILQRATLRLSWKLTYAELTSAPTGVHVHGPQTPGGNAGVVIDLAPNGVKSPLEGSVVLTEGLLQYLLTGRMYVNLHTVRYKEGELRGQIMRRRPDAPKAAPDSVPAVPGLSRSAQ